MPKELRTIGISEMTSVLDRAKILAYEGRTSEAREILERVLVPVLERPWALEIWIKLTRLLEPDQEGRVRGALKRWIRVVEAVLQELEQGSRVTEEPGGLLSRTLARIYWNQGYKERALEIYRRLVEAAPQDAELAEEFRTRICEVKGTISEKSKVILALENWVKNIQLKK